MVVEAHKRLGPVQVLIREASEGQRKVRTQVTDEPVKREDEEASSGVCEWTRGVVRCARNFVGRGRVRAGASGSRCSSSRCCRDDDPCSSSATSWSFVILEMTPRSVLWIIQSRERSALSVFRSRGEGAPHQQGGSTTARPSSSSAATPPSQLFGAPTISIASPTTKTWTEKKRRTSPLCDADKERSSHLERALERQARRLVPHPPTPPLEDVDRVAHPHLAFVLRQDAACRVECKAVKERPALKQVRSLGRWVAGFASEGWGKVEQGRN